MKFEKNSDVRICKVDASLGLVFGWAVVCKEDGVEYTDLQNHIIPESAMLKAATGFMLKSRKAQKQHSAETAGEIAFAFPLIDDIKDAFGIQCDKSGLVIGMKCNSDTLQKFATGEFAGFSIGGMARKMVEED